MKEKTPSEVADTLVVLPRMGEGIHEATVLRWLKAVGEKVVEGESLLEIATDKVDSELPAPHDGVVQRHLVHPGEVVAVGSPVAQLRVAAASLSTTTPAVAPSTAPRAPVAQPPAAPPIALKDQGKWPRTSPKTGRFYSPLVRNMAQQEGVSFATLETIPGTGKAGRLTKADLAHYLAHRGGAPLQVEGAAKKLDIAPEDTVLPLSRVRQTISRHMVAAQQQVPRVSSFVEVDVTPLVHWREAHKQAFQDKHQCKLTYTPLFVLALAQVLGEFPGLNAWLEGEQLIQKKAVNIGVAVALPDGNLMVPVVRGADELALPELVRSIADLAQQARNGTLAPAAIVGGTYTFTNLGGFHTQMGAPILLPPQVGILAAGAINKKPAVVTTAEGDTIAIRHIVMLTHTYDHRVVDGALGGRFVAALAQRLIDLPDELE